MSSPPGQLVPAFNMSHSAVSSPPAEPEVEGTLTSLPVNQDRQYAVYPPVVARNQTLGYVRDVNTCEYSRDIGRSSILNRRVFFQFGDTFCKNTHGEFVGLTSHTCARLNASAHPRMTQYCDVKPNGQVNSFIPLTRDEERFEHGEKESGGRVTLWSFGGIAGDGPHAERGWCWFEVGEAYDDGRMIAKGTGIARVIYDPERETVYAVRPSEQMLFDVNQPRWGTFSTLSQDGYIYLWGHHGNAIMLARVRPLQALRPDMYEYWDGHEYSLERSVACPVLRDMQQGAFYRTNLFHPGLGIKYIFVGVSNKGDSVINMGCSKTLEGPYELFEVADAEGVTQGGYMYCIYPHPWAFNEEEGQLMVTWSEPWPGGVVAAKLEFVQGPMNHYKVVSLDHLPPSVGSAVAASMECSQIAAYTSTTITPRGAPREAGPLDGSPFHLHILGDERRKVGEAALLLGRVVARLLTEWTEREEAVRRQTAEEAAEMARMNSRRRRFSNTVRRLFKRRGTGGAADKEAA